MDEDSTPSTFWRGRYWRGRATTAFVIIALIGAGLAFLSRELHYFLLGGAAVLLPAWWVVESWLGLQSREPYESLRTFWLQQFVMIATAAGVFTFNLLSRGDDWDWNRFDFFAVMLFAVLMRAVYIWRDAHSRRLGVFPAYRSRISTAAVTLHFVGYVLAFTAGLVAAGYVGDWSQRMTAYVGAVLITKFMVDLLVAPSPPLDDRSQTRALTRMTVLSPLLWGVPWGLLIAGYFMAIDGGSLLAEQLLAGNGILMMLNIAVATTFVFAVATIVVFVLEPSADKNWAASTPVGDGELRPIDWAMLYWAVLAGALALLTIVFSPREPSDDEIFGVDKWTCAKKEDKWTLARLSNGNFDIRVRGRYIHVFNVSCVPDVDGKMCEYDDEGWDEVDFLIHGNDGFDTTAKFSRKSKGVNANYRHHADVYDELANEILLALYGGKSADITVKAAKGRVLYTKRIDLTGYDKALDACAARWRKEAAAAR